MCWLEDRPTAVFTVNNLVALGAIEAVEAGLEVPDDVALVCFDDIEYASRLHPFLTVMEQPAETFGTLGVPLVVLVENEAQNVPGSELGHGRKGHVRGQSSAMAVRDMSGVRARAGAISRNRSRREGEKGRDRRAG